MNVKEVFGLFILTELLKLDHEFFQFYLDFHDLFQGDGVQLEMVFQQFEISLKNIGRKIGVEITHMKNAGQCFECFKFFLEPFIEIDLIVRMIIGVELGLDIFHPNKDGKLEYFRILRSEEHTS